MYLLFVAIIKIILLLYIVELSTKCLNEEEKTRTVLEEKMMDSKEL